MSPTLTKNHSTVSSDAIVRIMHDMIRSSSVGQLLNELLQGTWRLVCDRKECYGWVGKLDRSTGEIDIVSATRGLEKPMNIKDGVGITAKALNDRKIYNIANVQESPDYVVRWKETKSEIAIPIMVRTRAIKNRPRQQQIGGELTETIDIEKPIGVLNFESQKASFFSQDLEIALMLLCSFAGELIDKMDRSSKLEVLHEIEEDIRNQERSQQIVTDYDSVIESLVRATVEKLHFGIIHVSLVDSIRKNINSKYAYGKTYTLQDIEYLHKNARFSISESDDIQSHIVRRGKTEVPEINDSRFDKELRSRLKYYSYIRIYIPIIDPSNGSVIGTLEAGYRSGFNNHIYESDRYLLTRVISLILNAMERKRAILIQKVVHDLRSPVSSVRSNSDYLRRRVNQLESKMIQKKAKDMFNDCESLRHHISQLEYALTGKLTRMPRQRSVNIFTEVIVKTIEDKRGILEKQGFKLFYEVPLDLQSLVITTDIAKLIHVMHNLFDNAVKYCNPINSDSWEIRIAMNKKNKDDEEFVEIHIFDTGIGIKENHKGSVFNLGFRDPAVIPNVNGSGLGLSIAKDLMHEIGGDLELVNCQDPTTFRVTIPVDKTAAKKIATSTRLSS